MTATTIPVAEIFGPTIQGEGALAGKPTYFLRVGGCDFKCAWCDSGYAVNAEEVRQLERLTPYEIGETLTAFAAVRPGPHWVTISGGNPALYDLSEVVIALQTAPNGSFYVAVETQGSLWKDWLGEVDLLTVSPKPPSSGMPVATSEGMQIFSEFMRKVAGNHPHKLAIKIVVFDEADYEFARSVRTAYIGVDEFYLSCGTAMGGLTGKWVPPVIPDLGTDDRDWFSHERAHPEINLRIGEESKAHLLRRYRWLAERVASDPLMADVAVFPQLHALIWGIATRGV